MNKLSKKVVLTGGHGATTALSVIEALQKSSRSWEISWIGAKKAFQGRSIPSYELELFKNLGLKTFSITSERFARQFTLRNILSLAYVPIGLVQSLLILRKIKPRVILSFGGYASTPVVIAGWIFRIPVIIHEQTIAVGFANHIASYLATKIAISRPESVAFFSQQKIILTGNPISENIAKIVFKKVLSKQKSIFIFCGSRGSQVINKALVPILPKLLESHTVYHQTGHLDFEVFNKVQVNLPKILAERYNVYDFINPKNVADIYQKSDVVVARAGANTVSELVSLGKPSILIPIPWTRYNEQHKNALYAKNLGVSQIIEEKNLRPEVLLNEIENTFHGWNKMISVIENKDRNIDKNASSKVVKLLEELAEN